ncbi:hypothetical protein F5B19DRAFT_461660 [Rostrohypoxylon terebratum]|nr:hypothetical protein F5B19DRAFT_461660 [Rostrohypoxylon terebratum]
MYKPAPPRPKQSSIVRTRTGCRNCRARRKKCDEKKPSCTGCTRLGKRCDGYATKLEFRSVSFHLTESRDCQTQIIKSPRPSRELFYMNVWETRCAPALHPAFQKLSRLRDISPVVIDAMMALAARQLSRLLPRARQVSPLDSPNLRSSFRPDVDQQSMSGIFSSSAMRSVAQWTQSDFDRDSTTALAVLTLFCCFESLMSNFQGFYLHSAAVEVLLDTHQDFMSEPDTYERSLIAAWVQSRLHNWWRRFHFATVTFQREHPPLFPLLLTQPGSSYLGPVLGHDRRVSILVILCESYRLSAASLMLYCDGTADIGLVASRDDEILLEMQESHWPQPYRLLSLQEQLNHQTKSLSDWYAQLAPSELPADLYLTDYANARYRRNTLQIKPLQFESHDAAMNFAYFVTAQILHRTEFLDNLESRNRLAENGDDDDYYNLNTTEKWILILLRIAAGIDWDACRRLNAYTIGLSGLLLTCVLRSTNPAVSFWVQSWLGQRYQAGCLEEGSFPIYQILQVLQIINEEKSSDRHVYAVCQPTDDGGGMGKFDSYNSQRLGFVLLYGWCKRSNRFYSRQAALESLTPATMQTQQA